MESDQKFDHKGTLVIEILSWEVQRSFSQKQIYLKKVQDC